MIRWKYVLPRLVLAAAIIVAMRYSVDPAVRWSLTRGGRMFTSARLDIGDVKTSLVSARAVLSDVNVAASGAANKNLLHVDTASLRLDTDALARRKFVIDRAELRGIRFGAERTRPDEEGSEGGSGQSRSASALAQQLGEKWLDNFTSVMSDDVERELQSVKLARELNDRWQAEYGRLESRADAVRGRTQRLRGLLDTRERNPLRIVESYQQAAVEAERLQQELQSVRRDMDRLLAQAAQDKEAIAQAKQHDQELIRQKLRMDRLAAEDLSRYLWGPELGPRLTQVVQWVQWGRSYLPSKVNRPKAVRGRGQNVRFAHSRSLPDNLIRTVALEGEGSMGGEPFSFLGTATGLTTQPEIYGRPVELNLKAQGGADVSMQAVLDRTGETPHDRVLIDCPALAQPQRWLGRKDRLAVSVSPGLAHVWALVDVQGEALAGEIVMKQDSVQLSPLVDSKYGGKYVAGSIQRTADEIRSLEASVVLSGSLENPQWKIQSNLGNQLATGINQVVEHEVVARGNELTSRTEQLVAEHSRQLERSIMAGRQAILDKVGLGQAEIQNVLREIAGRIESPERLLGDKSFLQGVFRK